MPSSFADHENKISRYRSLAVIDNKANAVLRIPFAPSKDPTWKKIFHVVRAMVQRGSNAVARVLSKGVWWMPRLKKAMKDVV